MRGPDTYTLINPIELPACPASSASQKPWKAWLPTSGFQFCACHAPANISHRSRVCFSSPVLIDVWNRYTPSGDWSTSAKSSSSNSSSPNMRFNSLGAGPGMSRIVSMAFTDDSIAAMQSGGPYSWMGSKYCGKSIWACVTAMNQIQHIRLGFVGQDGRDYVPLLAIAPQTSSGYCSRM